MQKRPLSDISGSEYLQNILAGLTVSFAAISLGAAFGLQSGRDNGMLVGILSAGIIAAVTSLIGGTRIQCSGPTAPMTTVTMTIWAAASGVIAVQLQAANYTADHFMTVVLMLTAGLLILMAVLRLGKFISLVPVSVISGFMNGIAILIWVSQVNRLFGLGSKQVLENNEIVTKAIDPYTGGVVANVVIATVTCILLFVMPKIINAIAPKYKSFLPGTLIVIILMSAIHSFMGLGLQVPELTSIKSWDQITEMAAAQIPAGINMDVVWLALPFALNLTLLAYLDTLLTSLVMDKKVKETFGFDDNTKQNKELAAQGIANALVAFIGGIPGAQATIRSVLILKENATLRLAGVMSGIFVLVEMFLFQDWVKFIPLSVFAGLLIKVGYDVMDWDPLIDWVKSRGKQLAKVNVTNMDMFYIAGTTIVTVVYNLNAAVIGFTVIFYVLRKAGQGQTQGMDAPSEEETAQPRRS